MDILYKEEDIKFDSHVDGVQIHAECLSQDYDDIAWEPERCTDDVDPNDDTFGYYN